MAATCEPDVNFKVPIPIDVSERAPDGKEQKKLPGYMEDWHPQMGAKQVACAKAAQAVLDKGGLMTDAEQAARKAFLEFKAENNPIGQPGQSQGQAPEQEALARYLKAIIHLTSVKTEGLSTQELLDAAALSKLSISNIEEWANNLLAASKDK